jgi:DNA-directed RNA polymerase specialized sigma24 family protein
MVRSPVDDATREEFEVFVHDVEPSLRRALAAAYGFERGRDATAEALGWAWEHWGRAKDLENKVAFLFRVGQSKSRDRRTPVTFERSASPDHWFDPGLAPALNSLTEHQRIAVVLVNGFDWKLREVAELLGVGVSTIQSHLERGMRSLRNALEVVEND